MDLLTEIAALIATLSLKELDEMENLFSDLLSEEDLEALLRILPPMA
jgi:hypothetical protein